MKTGREYLEDMEWKLLRNLRLMLIDVTEKRDVCQMWHASRFLNILWHGFSGFLRWMFPLHILQVFSVDFIVSFFCFIFQFNCINFTD